MGIVQLFDAFSEWITGVVFFSVNIGGATLPLIVFWLAIAGVFFTFYLGFMNVRGFKLAIDLVRGKYSDPKDAGEVSHFQALATAVSGTVGLGNIAGVAVAISIGGPGATFWMIVAGFLGMSTKMAECMLAVKFRREREDGTVSGGPMYYLTDGLKSIGLGTFGKILAVIYAICMIGGSLGGGNMFQSNQATAQVIGVTGGDNSPLAGLGWVVGLGFALLVGVVIIGGIKSIARVTEKIVPFMAVLYITACLVVIIVNVNMVPAAFGQIIDGAFTGAGATGGVIGALIVGFQRAAFSNEAGLGSAAVAHSAVRTKEPATEGFVAALEPFIDTIVICTMTALAIVITGAWNDPDASRVGGVGLTSRAFETVLPWFPIVLAVAVILFAFSTMLSWAYYGMKAVSYLSGENRIAENAYKVIFCVFTVIGAAAGLDSVINFSDSMIFLLGLFNIIGLYLLAPVIRREIVGYFNRVRSGEVKQVEHHERSH
ncbi:AGCS family alanine or glycine:cation symporter [Kineosphaera limosa]|uniref:Putative sodium/alanine symporter n=1 Tax=Kineosphaera limosa NBRC 100340 TaxID=1184609 RepID=K6WUD4_9MICO|nr:alanine/glycine:cation symporter family protein [Kineosphaera limosa]NYD99536.1 AGCS family alanine or glycine:cation symporter [Kineosphaera limosa]GAB95707.1 putative sodium/alanine symporter [Kineosphaera limosa NBRC 100340]